MVELSWNLSHKLCCLCCRLQKMLVLLYLPFESGCASVYGAVLLGIYAGIWWLSFLTLQPNTHSVREIWNGIGFCSNWTLTA